jgi:predicted transcriptional regulator
MTLDQGAVDYVLSALADPIRRAILDGLAAQGGATATTLATVLPVSRQAVVKRLDVRERAALPGQPSCRRGRAVRQGQG